MLRNGCKTYLFLFFRMAICAFQFYIPQLMILIVESFHVKDGTLLKMLGKVIKNIMLSHIPGLQCITLYYAAHSKEFAENQWKHHFNPSILPYKFGLIFMRMKQKKFFFSKKKSKMAVFQKWPFFKIANSQNFFVKISQIRPWVSRIAWCEGHWSGSTYMVVRLSDISSKTG